MATISFTPVLALPTHSQRSSGASSSDDEAPSTPAYNPPSPRAGGASVPTAGKSAKGRALEDAAAAATPEPKRSRFKTTRTVEKTPDVPPTPDSTNDPEVRAYHEKKLAGDYKEALTYVMPAFDPENPAVGVYWRLLFGTRAEELVREMFRRNLTTEEAQQTQLDEGVDEAGEAVQDTHYKEAIRCAERDWDTADENVYMRCSNKVCVSYEDLPAGCGRTGSSNSLSPIGLPCADCRNQLSPCYGMQNETAVKRTFARLPPVRKNRYDYKSIRGSARTKVFDDMLRPWECVADQAYQILDYVFAFEQTYPDSE